VTWRPPRFAVHFYMKPICPDRRPFSKFTHSVGHYVPSSLDRISFLRMSGPVFEDYLPQARYWFFIDLLVMVVSAYVLAVLPDKESDCEWLFLGTIAIFGSYMVMACVCRPFTAMVANVVFVVTIVLQFFSAVFLYIAFKSNSSGPMQISAALGLLALIVQLLNLIYSVVKGAIEYYHGEDQNSKVTRIALKLEAEE
jgi:hypothetical protein